MKSWFHSGGGEEAQLILQEVPQPVAGAGELLVKVKAASLNRGEFLARRKMPADAPAKAAGIESAGEILAVGEGVEGFALGDRVMGRTAMAFSEYALMPSGAALPVPEALSWEEAACASITYLVAYDMLWTYGALQPNEWLLVAGATSGVGIAAGQLAGLIGARTIGTSRSVDKLANLRGLGFDLALQGGAANFSDRVLEETGGRGVDLVINNVGGSLFADCLRLLAYKGRLATVGQLDGVGEAVIDLSLQHAKRLQLFGVSNKHSSNAEISALVARFRKDVLPAFANGRIRPLIDSRYAFTDLPRAYDRMVSSEQLGKIVISIP